MNIKEAQMWIPEGEGQIVETIYQQAAAKRGFVPNIVRAFSLKPDLLEAFWGMSHHVTFGGTSLGRRREELLSFHVSSVLQCRY